ncbi:MAG: hypothetical protein RJB13_1881 [Pseudomonadota bacterium]
MIHKEYLKVRYYQPDTCSAAREFIKIMTASQDNLEKGSTANTIDVSRRHRIAIVGAGCCGLRIASLLKKYALSNKLPIPIEVVLIEKQSEVGGFLRSPLLAGNLIAESGAQGVLSSREIFLETLEDLFITPEEVIVPNTSASQQARFILTNEGVIAKLTPNPLSLWRDGLLTLRMLFNLFSELFRFISTARPHSTPEESLYQFFKRHFGIDCAEKIVIPIATGIWGGGAERLLLKYSFPQLALIERDSGSLLRHALKVLLKSPFKTKPKTKLKHTWPKGLISFPAGMQTLIERMRAYSLASEHFSLKTGVHVHNLKTLPDGRVLINNTDAFDSLFWTSAPWQTEDMSFDNTAAQALWNDLQQTPTHNLIVVNVSGRMNSSTRSGFGLLASRQSDGLLGVLFVHSIYKTHVPANTYSYRVLLGGDRNPDMIAWSENELQSYTIKKLVELRLIRSENDFENTHVVKWKNAIGIADVQHDERLSKLWRIEALYPQIRFAGIYKKGVGVADALSSAQEAVDSWLSELRPSR